VIDSQPTKESGHPKK